MENQEETFKIYPQLGNSLKTEIYKATKRGNEEFFASTASPFRTLDEQQTNAEVISMAVNNFENAKKLLVRCSDNIITQMRSEDVNPKDSNDLLNELKAFFDSIR